jgi:hypothetical protein
VTTTITINAKGHTATVQSVQGSGWGAGVAIDSTKALSVIADPGGANERTLHVLLNKPTSGPTRTTTSISNDTVSATFPLSGENPAETAGHPEFYDAYTGETVEVDVCEAAIFGDGTLSSSSLAAASSVTNSSDVALSTAKPICGWVSPFLADAVTGNTLTIDVFAEAGHGIDTVEMTFTDSASGTHTAFASRVVRTRQYPYGPEAFSMWRAAIDISTAAEGAGAVSFVATSNLGVAFNSVSESLESILRYIDRDASEPTLDMWCDSRESLPVSGTFVASDGDIIVGATSGAIAVVDGFGTANNEYVNTSTINVVRIKFDAPTATDFQNGETITGLTSGSAAATGVQTWLAPTINGTINNIAAPARDIVRAAAAIRTARNTAVSESTISGGRLYVLGNYTQTNHTANDTSSGTVNNPTHRTIVSQEGGGRFSVVNRANLTVSTSRQLLRGLYWLKCDFRPISPESNARALFATNSSLLVPWHWEDCEWHPPASGQFGLFGESNLGTTEECQYYMLGFKTDGSNFFASGGANIAVYKTILDTQFNNPGKADLVFFNSPNDAPGSVTTGNALLHFETDGIEGEAAGTHGDVVQGVNSVSNLVMLIQAPGNTYQGIFFNEGDDTNANLFARNLYIRTWIEQVDDGDLGSSIVSFNESAVNVVIEQSTLMNAAAKGSVTSIPGTRRCDHWWIRNTVFGSVSAGSGTNASNAVRRESVVSNCHAYRTGSAVGIRTTEDTDLSALFVAPWVNEGAEADYDPATIDWTPKAGGPLTNRITTRDIIGQPHYNGGELVEVGGPIGAFAEDTPPSAITITNSDGTTISQPVSATAQPNTDVRFVVRLNAVGQNLTGLTYTESGVLRLETGLLPLTLADGTSTTFAVLLRSPTLGANQAGSLTITATGGLSATVDYLLTVASPWSIRRSDGSAIPANPITGTFQQAAGGAVFQVRIDANADTLENFSYTTDGIVTLPTGPVELGPLSPGESKILNIFLDTATLGAGQTGYAEIDFDANGVAVTTIRMEFDIEVIAAVLEASRARSRSRIR